LSNRVWSQSGAADRGGGLGLAFPAFKSSRRDLRASSHPQQTCKKRQGSPMSISGCVASSLGRALHVRYCALTTPIRLESQLAGRDVSPSATRFQGASRLERLGLRRSRTRRL